MEPLHEPTSNPVLQADHQKRHAIKDALLELITEQPALTRATAQRHHGWKLEKLLLAKGYAIVPAPAAPEEAAGRDQVNTFCEKAGHVCTDTMCDNNGCGERVRHYAPAAAPATGVVGLSLADMDELRYLQNSLYAPGSVVIGRVLELLAALATPAAPGPGAAAGTGEAARWFEENICDECGHPLPGSTASGSAGPVCSCHLERFGE